MFPLSHGFISGVHNPSVCLSASSAAVKMTTARYRPNRELAMDPLVSCKLCLGEFPLEQMTTITQCQCVFCTLVRRRRRSRRSRRSSVRAVCFPVSIS